MKLVGPFLLASVFASGCSSDPQVDDGTSEEEADGDTEGETETGEDDNPCTVWLECLGQNADVLLSTWTQTHGPSGVCYDQFSAQECWDQCAEQQQMLYPECPPFGCGDGVLSTVEQCDSTTACLANCTFENHDCNPVNDAGCSVDGDCSWGNGGGDVFRFVCDLEFPDGPLQLGESCGPQSCQNPNFCLESQFLPDCSTEMCCTRWCYIGETFEDYGCPDGYTCGPVPLSINVGEWAPGAAVVGICR